MLVDEYERPTAGTERQLLALIEGLDRTRYDVRLVVLRATPYFRDELARKLPCESLDIASILRFGTLVKLLRFAVSLRRQGPTIVHIFFNDSAVVGPPFAKLGGAKVVVARRDMGYWYTPFLLRLLRMANRWVDVLVANSEAVRANVIDKEHMPKERTHVIYNGYRLPEAAEPRAAAPGGAPVIGIVATLREVKRHADLIAAMPLVLEEVPEARLRIVGDGPLRSDLAADVARRGLTDRVEFAGEVQDPAAEIRTFAVGVLCSESEGFSNAIIEYLACGVPVVCTNVGGNAEIVRDGYNGYLVPVGDSSRLAAAIVTVLRARSSNDDLQRNALATAKRYSLESMIAEYDSLYGRLLGKRA